MTLRIAVHFLGRLLLVGFFVLTCPVTVTARDLVLIQDDWIVNGTETRRDQHIRLAGSLVLPSGSVLTLENCTLEILGEYSREHAVEWQGGKLLTRNCTVGGFVNETGTAVHTVFHLYNGTWEATDTTVQFCYGISFHWKEGRGVLRGLRLKAGPRPDAIILSGEADVRLVDSDFPIGLGVYVDKGGETTLDLEPDKCVSAVFDRSSLLPGVNWRLELVNTRVARWFLFVRNIGMHHEPAEITLAGSKDLIASLLGHNLTGQIHLSKDLLTPMKVGNVTLATATEPAGISMYAIYLSGNENDVTVTGKSHICELMHRGGKLKIASSHGENEISIGCTTLELSGDAELEIHNVHLGRPLAWRAEKSIGEATIGDDALLTGSNVSVRNVRFCTRDCGRVELTRVERLGLIEKREEGGPIQIQELPHGSASPATN
jgi:hypothetical protein